MDNLINTFQFNHDDKAISDECSTTLHQWVKEHKDTCSAQDFLHIVEQLGDKLTQEQSPPYRSAGWEQAHNVFRTIISLGTNQMEDRLPKTQFHTSVLSLIVRLFKDGPTQLQSNIIMIAVPDVVEHTKSLQGAELKQVLEAACSPITIKEESHDKKTYEAFKLVVTDFIRRAFDEKQLQHVDYLNVIFEFLAHTHLDYSYLEKDSYHQVVSAGNQIYNYHKSLWKIFDNVTKIKQFIQRINAAVKQPGFPQSKGVEKNVGKLFILIRDITQKQGDAETYCNDVFDLLESLSQCQTPEGEPLLEMFSDVFAFFWRQKKDIIKKNPSLFNAVVPRFKTMLEILDMQFLIHTRFATELVDFTAKAFGKNKSLLPQWIALCVTLLSRPCANTIRACQDVIRQDDSVKWKEHSDIASNIFTALNSMEFPMSSEKSKEFFENYTSCVSHFLRGLKKSRILKDYGEGLMLLSIKLLEMKNDKLFDVAEDVAENIEINVKVKKELVMEVMKRIFELLKDEDLPWLSNHRLERAVADLMETTVCSVSDAKIFSNEDMQLLADMCQFCLSQDAISPLDSNLSPYYLMAIKIMNKLIAWLGATKRLGLISKLVPLFIKSYDEDDGTLFQLNGRFLNEIGQLDPSVLAPFLGQFIKIFLDKEDPNILGPINFTYKKNPHPLKEHFQEMLSYLIDQSNPLATMWLCQTFCEASKKQPELFTEENIEALVNMAINSTNHQVSVIQILQELARRKPEKMITNMDTIISCTEWNPMFTSLINDIVCTMALNVKSKATKAIDFLLNSVRTNQDKSNVLTSLNAVRLIGFKYPDIIKPKRLEIEQLKIIDVDSQNIRQTILDMVDGKTSDDLKKQLSEQQEALNELVDKVDEVEVVVVAMGDEVSNQGNQLQNVTKEVTEQGQRLDNVEETVEETVSKVEEIDSKTLSHAPYWSRDISKLLNPQTEHDWRLLSSRLGYSNDDIRGWAQQADPCMAMLNEWYATRKTSEATLAVLTHLQEMDRMDAAIIVENAMKNAEAVVEDEDFVYASPPPIFISYQWGHQEEVKLLKKHLEMAGYECWMDIGQMGGGDKLFEKIDSGIRAAKIVISCISNKYTKSPNCNREVNLSVGLHKPVIPLLLEQCPWPPPGSMGPIFSESLFIRFFQRQGEETKDDRYWSEPKFLELLMQLNMNGVPPDEAKIEPVYKNWWLPIEQEIKIDKNRAKNAAEASPAVKSDSDAGATESPDVFISYQWGKQKNIIKLYERLTSVGFSCWLDIKQMGGGDSLYDKIDRGIRGSKVVLSCVTQKYSLSPNCRREVSLADALKRPLIPLLLEKMTWPPPGPMSMVMTQLLYIGFTEETQQLSWEGPEFDELVSKLRQHIPERELTCQPRETVVPDKNNDNVQDNNTAKGTPEASKNLEFILWPLPSPPATPPPTPPPPSSQSSRACSII